MTIHGNKFLVGVGTGGIETPFIAMCLVYKLLSLISNRSLTIYIGMDSQDPNTPSGVDGSWPMGDGAMFVKVGGETP